MKILEKNPNRDFVILNISDPQLADDDYDEALPQLQIFERTVRELVEQEHPDLITVSGDISYTDEFKAYRRFALIMEELGVPWAPVWGNHDNQGDPRGVELQGEIFRYASPLCLYEKGEYPEDGQGNYIIRICEEGKPVFAIFMEDTHDMDKVDGEMVWSRLNDSQIEHIRQDAEKLKAEGCREAMMVVHIPFRAFSHAFKAAFSGICDPHEVMPQDSAAPKYWNEGYKDSFGVKYENIGCPTHDAAVFSMIKETGLIKNVLAGHSHICNFSINYEGIRLTFSLKAGCGSYWRKELNGGTVIRVGSDGVKEIRQHFVDVSDLIKSHL